MSNIKDFNYEILDTADGSPTLLLPESQPMHSLEGAFSETMEIYGPVAREALSLENPQLLSLGLGLGYNEIMTATMALEMNVTNFQLHSFEALAPLVSCFKAWSQNQDSPLNQCYDYVAKKFTQHFSVSPKKVKEQLREFYYHGAINSDNTTGVDFNGIFYDAFSRTTDPQLWAEDHLDLFLKNYGAEQCYISTYASTGILKRTLIANDFVVETKKGFGKKRESIFAKRI